MTESKEGRIVVILASIARVHRRQNEQLVGDTLLERHRVLPH